MLIDWSASKSPGRLPVEQSTKVDFVINQKTAKLLGLIYPLPLLGFADEVIERAGFAAVHFGRNWHLADVYADRNFGR
jgi:hypothetical protein